jgi:serine/threonine-protein kinase
MKAVKSIPVPLATTMVAPVAGQIVGERYRLEEWLESGAMGSVWRALQVRLGSPAAIKFLDPALIEVPEMLERFLQEARSAAAVQSAHVIQVFDYGSDGGLPYIAMEFLEGENLHARLARRGVLTPAELNKIFSEVARGLGQAHALGVIHRDVKPGNIFLAREGKHEVTKLIDFGIAKVKADALRVSQIVGTELGTLLGTPQYMSPEQMRGRSTLDYRTDLWSLAIIACECLTGCYPFSATTIGDLTVQICTEEPLAPSTLGQVPAGFDQWFFKGTSKEPSDRFESAAEMADALAKLLVPRERAPASARTSPLLVLPSAWGLRRAWSAASSRVLRLWALALDRACGLGLASAALLRTAARAVAQAAAEQAVRLPRARRLWSRQGGVALALLMVIAAGLLLGRSRRDLSPDLVRAGEPSRALAQDLPRGAAQEVRAVFPAGSQPAVQPTTGSAAPDPLTRPALPVLTPDDLPLVPVTEARAAPAKAPEVRRPSRKQSAPARAESSTSVPSSPMSSAMVKMGALIAQGGEKRRAVRSGAAASERGIAGAASKTDTKAE